MRCITSDRLTPAAATLTRISPAPGCGTGRSSGTRTSGPPGARMAMAVMREGSAVMLVSWIGRRGLRPVMPDRGGCDKHGPCHYCGGDFEHDPEKWGPVFRKRSCSKPRLG